MWVKMGQIHYLWLLGGLKSLEKVLLPQILTSVQKTGVLEMFLKVAPCEAEISLKFLLHSKSKPKKPLNNG